MRLQYSFLVAIAVAFATDTLALRITVKNETLETLKVYGKTMQDKKFKQVATVAPLAEGTVIDEQGTMVLRCEGDTTGTTTGEIFNIDKGCVNQAQCNKEITVYTKEYSVTINDTPRSR